MANITLTIPEDLENRLKKYPQLNKSEMFRDIAEIRLKIIEETETFKEKIPIEVLIKLHKEIEETSIIESLEFGKDIFLEWIIKNDNSKYLFYVAAIPESNHMFEDLYAKFGEYIGPIEEYEKEFEIGHNIIFDRETFSKGFISIAKFTIERLRSTKRPT